MKGDQVTQALWEWWVWPSHGGSYHWKLLTTPAPRSPRLLLISNIPLRSLLTTAPAVLPYTPISRYYILPMPLPPAPIFTHYFPLTLRSVRLSGSPAPGIPARLMKEDAEHFLSLPWLEGDTQRPHQMTFQWFSPSTSPEKCPLPQRTLTPASQQVSQFSGWLPGLLQSYDLPCDRTQLRGPRDEQKTWQWHRLDLQAQVGEFTHRVNKNCDF